MTKRLLPLLLTAAAVSGCGAFTEAAPRTAQIDQAASTETGQDARPASTTLRMRGTIETYTASTGILSLSTSSGIVQLPVASTARIRHRRDKIDAVKLENLVGYRVAVRYSESGGAKVVQSIQVFGKDEKTKR